MPASRPNLSIDDCSALARAAFDGGDDLLGVECEWFTRPAHDPGARPSLDEMVGIRDAITSATGCISIEPGGQVELSTTPMQSVSEVLRCLQRDEADLQAELRRRGVDWSDAALDTARQPARILPYDRYCAMEQYWRAGGAAGEWMMNNTASVQINISNDEWDPELRWRAVNAIGPVLVAMFANSGGTDADGKRWESLRQGIWATMNPCRTAAVRLDLPAEQAWLEYALAADVFVIRGADGLGTAVAPGFTFAHWLRDGHALGWPTEDDFRYHLSTLFPPVRPKGWLELRMLDSLPGEWRTAVTLLVAAATRRGACHDLLAAMPHTENLWLTAARRGLRDPRLRSAAAILERVALSHLPELDADPADIQILHDFLDRFTRRGLSPASAQSLRLPVRLASESFDEVETGQTVPPVLLRARKAAAAA